MGKGGYMSEKQPNDLPVMVGGIGTSGLQDENKDGVPNQTAVSMTPNDGDNPSISSAVAGPNGKDPRSYSGGNKSNPTPGMPGA